MILYQKSYSNINDKEDYQNNVQYYIFWCGYKTCIKDSFGNYPINTTYWKDTPMWSDDPKGITETHRYEYRSERVKVDGKWGAFSDPILWVAGATDPDSIDAAIPYQDGRWETTREYKRTAKNYPVVEHANNHYYMTKIGVRAPGSRDQLLM